MALREFKGAAAALALNGSLSAGATSFAVTGTTSGWPSGVSPFVVVIGPGTASEEKILCSTRSGSNFTVATGGRGYDGTADTTHASGESVEHVLDAATVTEANAHVNTTARDDHTQYLNTSRHADTAQHVLGTSIPVGVAGEVGRLAVAATAVAGSVGKVADVGHKHRMPLLPHARLVRSATLNVVTSAPTAAPTWITWDGEQVDNAGLYGGSGTTVTVTETGIWILSAHVVWGSTDASSSRSLVIELTSGGWAGGNHRTVTEQGVTRQTISDVRGLTDGDVLQVGVKQDSGATQLLAGSGGTDLSATFSLAYLGDIS